MPMLISIAASHDCNIIWEGVYHFALADYPRISGWELKKLITFYDYEIKHGRETRLVCDDDAISQYVQYALAHPQKYLSAQMPRKITECTACKQKGCLTDFLCHTSGIEDAKSIFACGKILSAVKARNKPAAELVLEPRNAAKDPSDYFDTIMFAWGNCQAGDRLVMERLLDGKPPDENDLSAGFQPGVRFYFTCTNIMNHANFVDDGYHPAKIRGELSLADYLYCCIIPEENRMEFENIIPASLMDRVFYIENDCHDIWDWSEKVYSFITQLSHIRFSLAKRRSAVSLRETGAATRG